MTEPTPLQRSDPWERWLTPLKQYTETHAIKIVTSWRPHQPIYLTCEAGDQIRVTFHDGVNHIMGWDWESELILKLLKEAEVMYVRKKEIEGLRGD